VIVKNCNATDLKTDIFTAFGQVSEWFNVNLLLLNFDKTCFMQIIIKNSTTIDMNSDNDNESVTNITNSKFLVIIIDNTFQWKSRIDQIILNYMQLFTKLEWLSNLCHKIACRWFVIHILNPS
jgi:hypothetical protein